MFPSSIARRGRTGARSTTNPWFRANELRVIMFIPHASPVVYAYMTWHMGPTTCVSSSRSLACFERFGIGSDSSQARMSSSWVSIQAAKAVACAVESKRNAEARVIRSPST